MKKLFTLLSVFILSTLLLVGCGGSDNTEEQNEPTDETSQSTERETTSDEESVYPLTVTDAIDNEVTIEEEPERIVSLMPSNTEIAFTLGLGDKIVGVSDHDNYPEEVNEKERVGGMELNVEVIIGLEPDLVLAHASAVSSSEEALGQLQDAEIPVFVVEDAQSIEATNSSIEQIGQITGTVEEAEEIVTKMQEGFNAIEERTAEIPEEERRSVFFEVSPAPDIFTAGTNTFFDELLHIIHADNVAGDLEGWVQIDPEAVVELNPEVVVTTYGDFVDNPIEQVLNRDGWGSVEAVMNEEVHDIHTDLVSRPGPRLAEGAKELAEVVYPQLFEE